MVASETLSSQLDDLANQAEAIGLSHIPGVEAVLRGVGRSSKDKVQAILLRAEVLLERKSEFDTIRNRLLILRVSIEPKYFEISDVLKVAAEIAGKPVQSAPLVQIGAPKFVNQQRIDDIRNLGAKSTFDVNRLVRLCEELNSSYAFGNLMAAAVLMRAIKDHCPPIFGQPNFSSVIAHLPGRPDNSTRKQLRRLEEPLKDVADKHLHTQISAHEPLPTDTQIISFQSDLDALLVEIARGLKDR